VLRLLAVLRLVNYLYFNFHFFKEGSFLNSKKVFRVCGNNSFSYIVISVILLLNFHNMTIVLYFFLGRQGKAVNA